LVRQVVLVRWKEGASDEAKRAVAEALAALPSEIPGVRDMRMGADLGLRPGNFDFVVTADFDDEGAYLFYRDHPAHQQVVTDLIRPVMAERAGILFRSDSNCSSGMAITTLPER
jgi:hypothetical protein